MESWAQNGRYLEPDFSPRRSLPPLQETELAATRQQKERSLEASRRQKQSDLEISRRQKQRYLEANKRHRQSYLEPDFASRNDIHPALRKDFEGSKRMTENYLEPAFASRNGQRPTQNYLEPDFPPRKAGRSTQSYLEPDFSPRNGQRTKQSYLEPDFSPRRQFSPLYEEFPPLHIDVEASRREYRNSVRKKPSRVLVHYHEDRRPSTNDLMSPPQLLQQRSSKMSLFSLFSKPKVETAHGYAEQGLAAPLTQQVNASRLKLPVTVEARDEATNIPPRSGSAMSFRNAKSVTKSKIRDAGSQVSQIAISARKSGTWEPPPLFQAFPQSMKHGILEVSGMTAEAVLQKSKSRNMSSLHVPSMEATPRESEETASMESKWSGKVAVRHVVNGSITSIDMPRKIIILATSGYVLQYAESGPSNRLPERVLELGKDSAAFASDLIPGKHYVLQISQAVDRSGMVIANTGSIFSKLGLRSNAARRTTSNLLLVMPNAVEMDKWLVKLREVIEMLGGKTRIDPAIRPRTRQALESGDSYSELKRTPGHSLRYHAKRDPVEVSRVGETSGETFGSLQLPPRFKGDDSSETCTLDGIEEQAEALGKEARQTNAIVPTETDTQSLSSSSAISEQHRRLSSLRDSYRISHATVATSRTNSMSGSPPSDESQKGSSETSRDAVPMKSAYRSLSSYALSRRRSAMPMPVREPPPPTINVSARGRTNSILSDGMESPVTGRNSPLPPLPTSPRKLLVAASEPNLRAAAADIKARQDSGTHLRSEESMGRPLSIIGDLPTPATLAGERAPRMRMPWAQARPAPATNAQRPMSQLARTSEPYRSTQRHSSQPFSLPLRVNPSTQANRPPTRDGEGGTFNNIEGSAGEPTVHTLTAKIDPSKQLSRFPTPPSLPSPKPDLPSKNPSRTPSGRLSLFPAQTALPSLIIPSPTGDHMKRSPPIATTPTYNQSQASGPALKRPTSMQVRTDQVPIVQAQRGLNTGVMAGTTGTGRSFTAPIRSLKPSRSSTYLTTQRSLQPLSTIPYPVDEHPAFRAIAPAEESEDRVTPLPDRGPSPSPSRGRPSSRARGERKLKTYSSLPELDLGIPVVGLGPPAPPPQAPLPAPPPASRSTSPLPMAYGMNGLGIRV